MRPYTAVRRPGLKRGALKPEPGRRGHWNQPLRRPAHLPCAEPASPERGPGPGPQPGRRDFLRVTCISSRLAGPPAQGADPAGRAGPLADLADLRAYLDRGLRRAEQVRAMVE